MDYSEFNSLPTSFNCSVDNRTRNYKNFVYRESFITRAIQIKYNGSFSIKIIWHTQLNFWRILKLKANI